MLTSECAADTTEDGRRRATEEAEGQGSARKGTEGGAGGAGKRVTVKAGDQIEYAIKGCADKNPTSGRPWAISDTRVAVVVDDAEFSNWLTRTLAERERLQELRKKQGSLFDQ